MLLCRFYLVVSSIDPVAQEQAPYTKYGGHHMQDETIGQQHRRQTAPRSRRMLSWAQQQQAQTVNMGFIGLSLVAGTCQARLSRPRGCSTGLLLSPLTTPCNCLGRPDAATLLSSPSYDICPVGLILQDVQYQLIVSNNAKAAAEEQCDFVPHAQL